MSTLYDVLAKAFEASPSLGWALLLLVWLVGAWWFRLVSVGPKRNFRAELLQRATIAANVGTQYTLAEIGDYEVSFSEAAAASDDAKEVWRALEVYSLYCTLRAREWLVKSASILYGFVAFAIAVMSAAGPTQTVTLSNVIQIVGLVAGLGVLLAAVLALVSLLVSLHTVPAADKRFGRLALFLFAW